MTYLHGNQLKLIERRYILSLGCLQVGTAAEPLEVQSSATSKHCLHLHAVFSAHGKILNGLERFEFGIGILHFAMNKILFF